MYKKLIDQRTFDFKQLDLKEHFPLVPIVAVTASATAVVQRDIIKELNMLRPVVLRRELHRPELRQVN